MYQFALQRPTSLSEATSHLGASVRPLAGGQTLIASLKLRLANPDALVDLSRIPDLALIRKDGNAIVIGAMARHVAAWHLQRANGCNADWRHGGCRRQTTGQPGQLVDLTETAGWPVQDFGHA